MTRHTPTARSFAQPVDFLRLHLPAALLAIALGGAATAGVPRGTMTAAHPSTTCDPVNPGYVAAVSGWDGTDILLFNDTPRNAMATRVVAHGADLGALYGLAVDRRRGQVYAAAAMDGPRPFGPGGPGAVYQIDVVTGKVSSLATVAAGPDPGPGQLTNPEKRRLSGKSSLGDVEIDATMSELFVANLFGRKIYRFALPSGVFLGAFDNGAADQPWAANARLMGLGYRDGWLYHGVVDSREQPELPGAFAGYVYRSREDGGELTEVARFPLDYRRESPWEAWDDAAFDPGLGYSLNRFQPLLSDIEFRPDGELVLGLRNRLDPGCASGLGGDVLPTRAEVPGRWSVLTDRDWYRDDLYAPDVPEALYGGLAPFPGRDTIVATVFAPTGKWLEYGAVWYDNATGNIRGPADGREPLTDDECQAMNDIELYCAPDDSIPTPTPSSTATPTITRTPTVTATPTDTATATSTTTARPSPTSTATLVPAPVFLPVLLDRPCVPYESRADVVLVLDLSTSMERSTRDGRSKLAAALDAATQFVAELRLEPEGHGRGDRVALVGFNDSAWTVAGLTADRAVIAAALAGLAGRMAEGTRLDLAFRQGQAVLAATPRGEGSQPVLVLLTDGLPQRVPTPASGGSQEDTVLAAALAVRAAGTRVFTVGLGQPDDVLAELLERAASAPGDYFFAPDGEDLAEIYRQIAGRLTGCP